MKTGLTKKQKITELYYNAKDPMAEVYTHDTKLKRRLLEYAAKFPELCQLTEDDEQGGLRFDIAKERISIRLTAPYSDERKSNARKWAKENGKFTCTPDIKEAAKGADVLYTDVWASMGQEEEFEQRAKIFKSYQINSELMEIANDEAMVLHCLPAHRGEEITGEVIEQHADEIFEEAENRLHAQKAVMVKLMA